MSTLKKFILVGVGFWLLLVIRGHAGDDLMSVGQTLLGTLLAMGLAYVFWISLASFIYENSAEAESERRREDIKEAIKELNKEKEENN